MYLSNVSRFQSIYVPHTIDMLNMVTLSRGRTMPVKTARHIKTIISTTIDT